MKPEIYEVVEDFPPDPDYSGNAKKDSQEIKRCLRVEQDTRGVTVYVIVSHKDPDNNRMLQVPASSGEALNNEVHNLLRDEYNVHGVDYHEIGPIPVNYVIRFDDTFWEQDIPLPFPVIKRYMSEEQKRDYDEWRSKYPTKDHEFKYLQVLGMF